MTRPTRCAERGNGFNRINACFGRARLAGVRRRWNGPALINRQMAVNQAQRALHEAEARVRKVKGWCQNFDHCADPIVKKLESLRQVLDQDMPKAITYLSTAQRTLEAYADAPAPTMDAPATTPPAETGGQP